MYKVGETYTLTGYEPVWIEPSKTLASTIKEYTYPLRAECVRIDSAGDAHFRPADDDRVVIVHGSANVEQGFDVVDKPEHYNTNLPEGIEVLDIIAAQTENLSGLRAVCQGNLLKYALRWQKKNGVEDLKKARAYIDRLIEEME